MLHISPSYLISVDSLCLYPDEFWGQVFVCKGNDMISGQHMFHQNRFTVTGTGMVNINELMICATH